MVRCSLYCPGCTPVGIRSLAVQPLQIFSQIQAPPASPRAIPFQAAEPCQTAFMQHVNTLPMASASRQFLATATNRCPKPSQKSRKLQACSMAVPDLSQWHLCVKVSPPLSCLNCFRSLSLLWQTASARSAVGSHSSMRCCIQGDIEGVERAARQQSTGLPVHSSSLSSGRRSGLASLDLCIRSTC